MACPCENKMNAKHEEKLKNINNLHLRSERGAGYNVMIISIVIGCLGGGMRRVTNQIGRLISEEKKTRAISNEMMETVLFEKETLTRKVISGLTKK